MKRAICLILLLHAAAWAAGKPETVMIRFQAKAGSEDELARVIARHWKTASELKLVLDAVHTTVRGADEGKTWFIDIFTWRDAETPDHAPAAIQAIWGEMSRLVEARGGRPGLEISEVSLESPRNN